MTDASPATILIADDNPQILELLEAYLAPLAPRILTARDGEEALALIEEQRPDVVVLDVMMPRLSGFQVCDSLKADERTRDIPIIMVTALNEIGDIERARECGADVFLSKPVNKLELLDRVREMLPSSNG